MEIIYVDLKEKYESTKKIICLGDLAQIVCRNADYRQRASKLQVYCFTGEESTVIAISKVVDLLMREFKEVSVISLGESKTLTEYRDGKSRAKGSRMKVVFLCTMCFFGSAFTIAAFHNDIGIDKLFGEVYRLLTGKESNHATVLELAYSLGLCAGLMIFSCHIGGKKNSEEPTPLEMQIYEYEEERTKVLEQEEEE